MKQEQAHIDQIKTAFEKMQSREDLLHLLNEVKPLIYGEKAVPFDETTHLVCKSQVKWEKIY